MELQVSICTWCQRVYRKQPNGHFSSETFFSIECDIDQHKDILRIQFKSCYLSFVFNQGNDSEFLSDENAGCLLCLLPNQHCSKLQSSPPQLPKLTTTPSKCPPDSLHNAKMTAHVPPAPALHATAPSITTENAPRIDTTTSANAVRNPPAPLHRKNSHLTLDS